ISSDTLLERLAEFVDDQQNVPDDTTFLNGTVYRKPKGEKIASTREYRLVEDDDDLFLFVKLTKGRTRGELPFQSVQN
ncbi:unnamed protein product, partial [Didymodactylos carnosus]